MSKDAQEICFLSVVGISAYVIIVSGYGALMGTLGYSALSQTGDWHRDNFTVDRMAGANAVGTLVLSPVLICCLAGNSSEDDYNKEPLIQSLVWLAASGALYGMTGAAICGFIDSSSDTGYAAAAGAIGGVTAPFVLLVAGLFFVGCFYMLLYMCDNCSMPRINLFKSKPRETSSAVPSFRQTIPASRAVITSRGITAAAKDTAITQGTVTVVKDATVTEVELKKDQRQKAITAVKQTASSAVKQTASTALGYKPPELLIAAKQKSQNNLAKDVVIDIKSENKDLEVNSNATANKEIHIEIHNDARNETHNEAHDETHNEAHDEPQNSEKKLLLAAS